MSVYTAITIYNSILAICSTVLVLGLYYMGFGGFSFFGLLLIFAAVSGGEDNS